MKWNESQTYFEIEKQHFQGQPALVTSGQIAKAIRTLVKRILKQMTWPDDIAFIATGGFGKGTMAPFSDIDLLVLANEEERDVISETLQHTITRLWDLGLQVGCSIRDEQQTIALTKQDGRVLSGLLTGKVLHGSMERGTTLLSHILTSCSIDRQARLRIKEQLVELNRKRYQRFGDTVFLLEPNIKEGKGGLRDLQALFWWASLLTNRQEITFNEIAVLLGEDESNWTTDMEYGHELIWQIRHTIHFVRGRPHELFNFDLQEAFTDRIGSILNLTDEQSLMRRLYAVYRENARALARLLEITSPNEKVTKHTSVRNVVVENGAISLQSPETRSSRQEKPIKTFADTVRAFSESGLPIKASTRFILPHLIQDQARPEQDHRLQELLKKILLGPRVSETLTMLHESDVLTRLIPEFLFIDGLFQRDLFHIYTVDVHSLKVVELLENMKKGALKHELPFFSSLMRQECDPELLYLAGLLHDIGKGSGDKHEEVGVKRARRVLRRMGWHYKDIDEVLFLIKHHLLLPLTSERQDIYDPNVIDGLKKMIKTRDRLRRLMLLSVADEKSVGPKGFSAWKKSLLLQLFHRVEAGILGSSKSIEDRIERQRRRCYQKLKSIEGTSFFLDSLPDKYFARATPRQALRDWRCLRSAEHNGIGVDVRNHQARNTATLTICARDTRGLFNRFVAGLVCLERSILFADIITTNHGFALDHFELAGVIRDPKHFAEKLSVSLLKYGRDEEAMKKDVKRSLQSQSKHVGKGPKVTNRIHLSPEGPSKSRVDVETADRFGLLFDITQIFLKHGLAINQARINTEGRRVKDSFLIHRNYQELHKLKTFTQDLNAVLGKERVMSFSEESAQKKRR